MLSNCIIIIFKILSLSEICIGKMNFKETDFNFKIFLSYA